MRNIKIIVAITTTAVLLASSVFANPSSRSWPYHEVLRQASGDKNPKLLLVAFDGKREFATCMEPGASLGYTLHNFSLGSHTATYLQCADKLCKNTKEVGVDKFVVSKDVEGGLVSTPESYQLKMDDGYGVNCDFGDHGELDSCVAGTRRCTAANTGVKNTNHLGKWTRQYVQIMNLK